MKTECRSENEIENGIDQRKTNVKICRSEKMKRNKGEQWKSDLKQPRSCLRQTPLIYRDTLGLNRSKCLIWKIYKIGIDRSCLDRSTPRLIPATASFPPDRHIYVSKTIVWTKLQAPKSNMDKILARILSHVLWTFSFVGTDDGRRTSSKLIYSFICIYIYIYIFIFVNIYI